MTQQSCLAYLNHSLQFAVELLL